MLGELVRVLHVAIAAQSEAASTWLGLIQQHNGVLPVLVAALKNSLSLALIAGLCGLLRRLSDSCAEQLHALSLPEVTHCGDRLSSVRWRQRWSRNSAGLGLRLRGLL